MSDLPRELADLYAADRAASASNGARAAVRAKLAATVGHAPLGAAVGGGLGVAGKVLAVLALTVGVGAATVAALHHSSAHMAPAPAPRIAHAPIAAAAPAPVAPQVASPTSSPVPPAVPPPVAHPSHRTAPLVPVTAAAAPPAPATPAAVQAPAPSEAALVRDAWLALSAKDPARALELVHDDERLHPDGPLAEERSALDILALAALGRIDDARAAATAFDARYPASVHHDLIARAIAKEASR